MPAASAWGDVTSFGDLFVPPCEARRAAASGESRARGLGLRQAAAPFLEPAARSTPLTTTGPDCRGRTAPTSSPTTRGSHPHEHQHAGSSAAADWDRRTGWEALGGGRSSRTERSAGCPDCEGEPQTGGAVVHRSRHRSGSRSPIRPTAQWTTAVVGHVAHTRRAGPGFASGARAARTLFGRPTPPRSAGDRVGPTVWSTALMDHRVSRVHKLAHPGVHDAARRGPVDHTPSSVAHCRWLVEPLTLRFRDPVDRVVEPPPRGPLQWVTAFVEVQVDRPAGAIRCGSSNGSGTGSRVAGWPRRGADNPPPRLGPRPTGPAGQVVSAHVTHPSRAYYYYCYYY